MKQTCITLNERKSSVKISKKIAAVGAASAALALMLAGCSSGTTTTPATSDTGSASSGSGAGATGTISIAYIQKQAGQQYFVAEKQGAQQQADSIGGVKVTFYPLADNADDSAAIDAVNQAIAAKVDGIIIVPPDGAVGPQVTQLANAAGIKIMSSDDQVCTNNPDPTQCDPSNLLPRVGFDGTEMGTEVGTEAATLYKASGWAAADTQLVRAWGAQVTVCTQRVDGALAAYQQNGGQFATDKPIDLSTDNTPTGAQDAAAAMLTANQGVKNWVVVGCNDENVSGVVTAMQNAGISPDNIDAVGLGGYLACKPWYTNTPTGMKAALYISGVDVGSTSIQVMHDWIANGTQPPAQTLAPTHMVTPDNWQTTMGASDLAACQAS